MRAVFVSLALVISALAASSSMAQQVTYQGQSSIALCSINRVSSQPCYMSGSMYLALTPAVPSGLLKGVTGVPAPAVAGTDYLAPNGTSLPSSYTSAPSLATVGTLTGGATGTGFTLDLNASTVSGTLPTANTAALSGDVTKAAGSATTTISAGAVTAAKLASGAAAANLAAGNTIQLNNNANVMALSSAYLSLYGPSGNPNLILGDAGGIDPESYLRGTTIRLQPFSGNSDYATFSASGIALKVAGAALGAGVPVSNSSGTVTAVSGCYAIEAFGGKGDGATTNDTAMSNAELAFGSNDICISFGPGKFIFSNQVSIALASQRNLRIIGAGKEITQLFWGARAVELR